MSFNKVLDTLDAAEKEPARSVKIQMLQDLIQDPGDWELLKWMYVIAFNPFWRYGWNPTEDELGRDPFIISEEANSNKLFFDFLDAVVDIVQQKVNNSDRVKEIVKTSPRRYSLWFAKLLAHDWITGISWGSMEKLFPKAFYGGFSLQLCDTWDGSAILRYPLFVEPKLDGFRCVIQPVGDSYEAYSRSSKPLYNCEHIFEELKSRGLNKYVLDGEVCAGNSWNRSASIARTQSQHPDRLELKYYVFDIIPLEDWMDSRTPSDTLSQRKSLILDALSNMESVVVVPWQIVDEVEALGDVYKFYCSEGYEGVVIKIPDGGYDYGRSSSWMKFKPTKDIDCEVVGVQEGTGRLVGSMGALSIGYDGVVSNVGTGFSDEDRDYFWNLNKQGQLLGTVVEIKYQDKTPEGVLRFPVYLRFRGDRR